MSPREVVKALRLSDLLISFGNLHVKPCCFCSNRFGALAPSSGQLQELHRSRIAGNLPWMSSPSRTFLLGLALSDNLDSCSVDVLEDS